MGGTQMLTDPGYGAFDDDDPKATLAKVISPASADALVGPPPDAPPPSQPGQSTPRTGNLAVAPKQAVAKNMDTPMGRAQYTGISNPPIGGITTSGPSAAQPAQALRPAVSPAAQAAQPLQPAQVNPDPNSSLRPGGTSSPMPALPQTALQPVQGPSQLDRDQARLNQMITSGSGISQFQKNHPVIGGILRGLDVAGQVLTPGLEAAIPGTTGHHQVDLAREQQIVGNDQAQQQAAAQTEDTNQQTAQRAADAAKAGALAEADKPFNPTAEQAAAIGHPEIAGLPITQRTYATMLKAKQDADSREKVGEGHDTASITRTDMRDKTAVANNAATNQTRLATSKYGPGNKSAGAGTGSGEISVSQPGDLSGVPANLRGLVQAIGEGREGPAPLGRKDGKEIMRLVSQVYPDYDASQFHNYQATRNEFSKGKTGQAINSFNTALQHLGRMENNLPKNTSLPAVNWLANTAKDLTGSAANTPFEADRLAVASEIGKAYKGGVLSKEENDQYQKLLDRDASPAQQHANINELKGLLGGKLNSFDEQYKTGLPTGATRNFQIISPEASAVLNRRSGTQPASTAPAAAIPAGNIRVQLPDGRVGHIAASQRTQFLKDNQGAKTF